MEVGRGAAVAREQVAQDVGALRRLRAAAIIERDVVPALQPALDVPVGQPVPNVIEHGAYHQSFATLMSGASGCFMPTM